MGWAACCMLLRRTRHIAKRECPLILFVNVVGRQTIPMFTCVGIYKLPSSIRNRQVDMANGNRNQLDEHLNTNLSFRENVFVQLRAIVKFQLTHNLSECMHATSGKYVNRAFFAFSARVQRSKNALIKRNRIVGFWFFFAAIWIMDSLRIFRRRITRLIVGVWLMSQCYARVPKRTRSNENNVLPSPLQHTVDLWLRYLTCSKMLSYSENRVNELK